MEKLCSMHCKNSPLTTHSEAFIRNHPNPYIDVFETVAAYPDAMTVPQVPLWPEVRVELTKLAERLSTPKKGAHQEIEPRRELEDLQQRLQQKLDTFNERQAMRRRQGAGPSMEDVTQ
jgi:hypothetical protein